MANIKFKSDSESIIEVNGVRHHVFINKALAKKGFYFTFFKYINGQRLECFGFFPTLKQIQQEFSVFSTSQAVA